MFVSESNLAALTGTSLSTTQAWSRKGVYPSKEENGIKGFDLEDLHDIPEAIDMINTHWDEEMEVKPLREYTSVELFAGGGGLALGMAKAGFRHVLLNEFNAAACKTLRANMPHWNVIEGDVHDVDFTPLRDKVDFLSGGFPCQAFSYAGKQGGFNDTRGTLFFELARAVQEIRPKVFMGENVKGLTSHDDGKTLEVIRNTITELGYTLVEPRVLKAIMYQVPQKRERLILIAIRNDIAEQVKFQWPSPYKRVMLLRDALYKSVIYDKDVPKSVGVSYPEKKQRVLSLVPQGGDWRDLPEDVAKEYMGGSWLLGGGKTGMARRLSLDEPSLTLTCSPCQKQTERCHPIETRPLTIREYARIQTFPDEWQFEGTISDRYKQIGNAVPVNLAWAIGRSLIRLFNDIQQVQPSVTANYESAVRQIMESHNQEYRTAEDSKPRIKYAACKVVKQVKFEEVKLQFPDEIVDHSEVKLSEPKKDIRLDVDLTKNVLVSFVKSDNIEQYLDQSAKVYYTGKKFPSTVALNKLFYFMPYISKKGIRDLYLIRIARVGTRKEGQPGEDKNDLRLVFEIEYIGTLFEDYKPINLEIWHAFTDTTMAELMTRIKE